MTTQYPKRPHSHNLEEQSERCFIDSLPQNWTANKPPDDYGVDLVVNIFEGELAKGLELLVQLKSSKNASPGATETTPLRVASYNYLWGKLQVVMLVKYVEDINEAYWILMKDIPEPNQKRKTFTVHIPKENTLSIIRWNEIQYYVRKVTQGKLAAWRSRRAGD